MNYSKQRSLILDIVRNTKCHPTAEWVHIEAKKVLPKIGIATVYRNLNTLADMGEILKLADGEGQIRFDGTVSEHFHFKCNCCGSVSDLDNEKSEKIASMRNAISEAYAEIGAAVDFSSIMLKGMCNSCRNDQRMLEH